MRKKSAAQMQPQVQKILFAMAFAVAEYSKHLLRVNKKSKLCESVTPSGGERLQLPGETKVILAKLRAQEEAEKTAREVEIKLRNTKPVEFYENIAKNRLHAVTSKKLTKSTRLKRNWSPSRIARVADFFEGFGKESRP